MKPPPQTADPSQRRKVLERIWCASVVSARTGAAIVELEVGKEKRQLDVAAARDLALNLLDAAAAAEHDAYLMRFLKAELGLEPVQGVNLLARFRAYRNEPASSTKN